MKKVFSNIFQIPWVSVILHLLLRILEFIVAKLKKRGAELFGEIQNYENVYKLCYVRGPEGIVLELAEKIK